MTLQYTNSAHTIASEEIGGVTFVYREGAPMPTEGLEWADIVARNPAPYVAPPEPSLPAAAEIRAQAYMPKKAFIQAAVDLGLITKADQLLALQNQWPPSMAPALTGMTEEQALDAQIEFAGENEIARTNATVLLLAEFLELTETQLDALFGLDLS